MVKHTSAVAFVICLALTSNLASIGIAVDFSGTWKLDNRKGSSPYPPNVAVVLTITQAGDSLSVERAFTGLRAGDGVIKETYVISGKRVSFSVRVPTGQAATGFRTTQWSKDGQTLEVADDADNDSPAGPLKITSRSTWSLSDEGKTLKIRTNSQSPFGERLSEMVFRKQSPT